jgi:hypothetical protein
MDCEEDLVHAIFKFIDTEINGKTCVKNGWGQFGTVTLVKTANKKI